jgi:AbrB family looped-hinge helix DNA binding protein
MLLPLSANPVNIDYPSTQDDNAIMGFWGEKAQQDIAAISNRHRGIRDCACAVIRPNDSTKSANSLTEFQVQNAGERVGRQGFPGSDARVARRGRVILVDAKVSRTRRIIMTITVSEKGWVVIPAELRREHNLRPGAKVQVIDYGGILALVPTLHDPIAQARGCSGGANHSPKPCWRNTAPKSAGRKPVPAEWLTEYRKVSAGGIPYFSQGSPVFFSQGFSSSWIKRRTISRDASATFLL